MCKVLKISRNMIYYTYKLKEIDVELEKDIIQIFNQNRKVYGTRKIKKLVSKQVSRKSVSNIMKKYNLVSKYTIKCYKHYRSSVNNSDIGNVLDRNFSRENTLDVIVSDLTYVQVGSKWNYICTIIDLYNREIIGFSVGKNKTSSLVLQAFNNINRPLSKVNIFHSDRGSEFKNQAIDELLKTHNITRSLSAKGTPYDNAVSESTYHIIKTEFVFGEKFNTIKDLELQFFDYVNWYNNHRIHGSLGYLSPVQFKLLNIA